MSDRPIKAGDLVMVVRAQPCCGYNRILGRIYKVVDLSRNQTECLICGATHPSNYVIAKANSDTGCLTNTLIRIDPPATGDSLPTRKDIEEHV